MQITLWIYQFEQHKLGKIPVTRVGTAAEILWYMYMKTSASVAAKILS